MTDQDKSLEAIVKKHNIGGYKRHMLLCTGPKCCQESKGKDVWAFLKRRLLELGLTPESIFRSKVGCLRICQKGPIAVVYPEGTWYKLVDEQACEQIIQSHLIEGKPVKSLSFAENPL